MVCDQTDGYVIHGIYFILLSGHLTNLVADRFHGINIKYGIHILHNNCQTLKSHTGINIFLGKLGITALAVPFKLCKHVVPYFHSKFQNTDHMDRHHAPRSCHILRSQDHGKNV